MSGLNVRTVTVPELGLIALTRVALGIGIGLLISEKFNAQRRRAVGRALLLTGIATTVPIAMKLFGRGG